MLDSLRFSAGKLAAEFTVIVLGVLVALAVDEWRESRNERVMERVYYASLADDLRRDTAEYRSSVDVGALSVAASRQVLGTVLTSAPEATAGSVSEALLTASFLNYPERSTATIDELMSTGNLRLIEDHEIKVAMLDYYRDVNEWEPRLRGEQFAGPHLEYRRLTGDLRFRAGPESGPLKLDASGLSLELRRRQELAPLLGSMIANEAFRTETYLRQREAAARLLSLIDERQD